MMTPDSLKNVEEEQSSNPHEGSTLQSLFEELGEREEVEALAQRKITETVSRPTIDDSPLPWDEEDARLAGMAPPPVMSHPKPTAETNIREALDAYRAAFPGDTKPSISVSTFPDGTIQLFMTEPHGQGTGQTLEEAALNLKAHFAKHLRALCEKEAKSAEEAARRSYATQDRLNKAAWTLEDHPPSTGGFTKLT